MKKNENKAKKKRREFSKIMAVITITMWVIVNFFGMAMVIFTMDSSPLAYVIPSVDAVTGAIIAFYLWKARAENQIKLRQKYRDDYIPVDDEEEYGTPEYENSNIV